jgi:uncharacterized damage-inducible protein DinB
MRISILLLFLFASFDGQTQISCKEFLDKWDRMEDYLIDMAECMPDSLYSFKPVDEVFSFDQQLHHIVNHLNVIDRSFLLTRISGNNKIEYKTLSKLERIAQLHSIFQDVRETIFLLHPEDMIVMQDFKPAGKMLSKSDFLFLLLHHTTHHAGQMVIYLRLNGIKPPRYVGW